MMHALWCRSIFFFVHSQVELILQVYASDLQDLWGNNQHYPRDLAIREAPDLSQNELHVGPKVQTGIAIQVTVLLRKKNKGNTMLPKPHF